MLASSRASRAAKLVLDRRADESFAWPQQLRPFRVAKPGAYREYRLRFEQGAELAEIELLESGPAGAFTKTR